MRITRRANLRKLTRRGAQEAREQRHMREQERRSVEAAAHSAPSPTHEEGERGSPLARAATSSRTHSVCCEREIGCVCVCVRVCLCECVCV